MITIFSYDSLTIYDGDSNAYPMLGKYYGTSIPPSQISSINKIFIHFQSDGSHSATGFKLEYHQFGNHWIISLLAGGVITSPGFPGNYDDNLDLTWLIQVQMGQIIEINFLSFDLEYGGQDCS